MNDDEARTLRWIVARTDPNSNAMGLEEARQHLRGMLAAVGKDREPAPPPPPSHPMDGIPREVIPIPRHVERQLRAQWKQWEEMRAEDAALLSPAAVAAAEEAERQASRTDRPGGRTMTLREATRGR